MRRSLASFGLLFFLGPVLAWSQDTDYRPDLSGYITAVTPDGRIDVAGTHIRTTPATTFLLHVGHVHESLPKLDHPYLGESAEVFGKLDSKNHTLTANHVEILPPQTPTLSGSAIIDSILDVPRGATGRDLRADGYCLHLTSKTILKGLRALDNITTNMWVTYHGVQQADGTVVVDKASIRPNVIVSAESNLQQESNFDPSVTPPDAAQGGVSKFFKGVDPRKLPPHQDAALQARIDQLGQRLIPVYQRNLPDTDPSRIDFRFPIIDSKNLRHPFVLSSGIIILPFAGLDRLQNDSQIAAVLADGIAILLERQDYRSLSERKALTVAELTGFAGGVLVPGLGVATFLAVGGAGSHMLTVQQQQSGRVSLGLLHDAGFDLAQAPIAWQLLEPGKPRRLEDIPIPPRAANLYGALGTAWRSTSPLTHTAVTQPVP